MGATIAGPRSKSSSREGRAGEAERSGLLNPRALFAIETKLAPVRLFLSYCSQRIDFGCASCRNIAGNKCHHTQQNRDGQIHHGIVRLHVE